MEESSWLLSVEKLVLELAAEAAGWRLEYLRRATQPLPSSCLVTPGMEEQLELVVLHCCLLREAQRRFASMTGTGE